MIVYIVTGNNYDTHYNIAAFFKKEDAEAFENSYEFNWASKGDYTDIEEMEVQ